MARERRTTRKVPREVVAHHEAGHFVASFVLRSDADTGYATVTIVPDGQTLGAHHGEEGLGERPSTEAVENAIVQLFAGSAAEVKHSPKRRGSHARSAARSDDDQAETYLNWLRLNGKGRREKATGLRLRAENLIEDYWPAVVALADELLEHNVVTGDEATWIVAIAIGETARKALAKYRSSWVGKAETARLRGRKAAAGTAVGEA
jgi:hypothetical protein